MQPSVCGHILKALACDLSSIDALPPDVLRGPSAAAVREANFSFNSISGDSLATLSCFPALETLILDNNEIESIRHLPRLDRLATLWINNNLLGDLEEVVAVLAKQCPRLQYLSLLRNPCCPHDLSGRVEAEYHRYRVYLKYALPSLTGLDASKITESEAAEAAATGRFRRTAVHREECRSAASLSSVAGADELFGRDDVDLFQRHSSSRLFTEIEGGSFDCSAHSSLSSSFTLVTEVKKEPRAPKGATPKLCEGNRFIKDDAL
jgi:hypothetical protein